MNQRLDQLRLGLSCAERETENLRKSIHSMEIKLGQLAENKSKLLKEIAEETIVRNPCVMR